MVDPLANYPDMMSTDDLAIFLNCGRDTAAKEMQKLPFVTIGEGRRNKSRRVSKEHIRIKYKLPEPEKKPNLRLAR